MTRTHKEEEALSMLKTGKFQPSQVARKTGLSLFWVEGKAKQLGLIPLGVVG